MATGMTRATKLRQWLSQLLADEQAEGAPLNVLGMRIDPGDPVDNHAFVGDPTAPPNKTDFVNEALKGWRKL